MKTFYSQILALLTFFAFPIFEYVVLRFFTQYEGNPELWYLPDYGFRLVIRNLPRKKRLFDINYRSFLRKIIPPSEGCSVSTFLDYELNRQEDFFLFPGTDQIVISFRLERDINNEPVFINTDKLGNELSKKSFQDFNELIADYMATIDNMFRFDFKISKRVKLNSSELEQILDTIKNNNTEQQFKITKIQNVG